MKLIWLGIGFLNRAGVDIGYREYVRLKEIGTFYFLKKSKNTANPQLLSSNPLNYLHKIPKVPSSGLGKC